MLDALAGAIVPETRHEETEMEVEMNIRRRCDRRLVQGPRAPHIVVDEQGREVGVFVDYPQYVALLGLMASELDRDTLPRYWRGALDGCLLLSD